MARLVNVFEPDSGYKFQRRQVPLEVDNLKMVVQFSDKCMDCEKLCGVKQKDLDFFYNKFNSLTKDEIAVALLVPGRDILSLLSHMVPCVGCRKSVERLFTQLQKSQHPAMEPLVITPRGELSVKHEYLFDPRSLFSLFHVHASKLHSVVEAIPKSKKNKRCNLHSLETHKSKTLGCWLEAWNALSVSCREKVLIVDMDRLLTNVESYLEKHKFCSECKSKVLLAYSILVGEVDHTQEKGYCAALYEQLSCCAKERHVHVYNDTEFIAHLLEKAEPEFLGGSVPGKRDRHAKTLDIAQEEVLTCLGIHIFERLHHVWQKLRCEEQTWLILFYIGVDALQKSYQVALEEKQGASALELLCEELEEKEKRLEEKKELKRLKRQQKKKAKAQLIRPASPILEPETPEPSSCQCTSNDKKMKSEKNNNLQGNSKQKSAGGDFNHVAMEGNCRGCQDQGSNASVRSNGCKSKMGQREGEPRGGGVNGFQDRSSGKGGGDTYINENCKCGDSGESPTRSKLKGNGGPPNGLKFEQRANGNMFGSNGLCKDAGSASLLFQANEQPSLTDLLDDIDPEDEGEDDEGISEEEIKAFKAQQVEVDSKRQLLRATLRQRFAQFQVSKQVN